jgi:hypothetical protein
VSVSVKLGASYTAHGKTFNTVTLREPTFGDIYVDGLGEPEEVQPTAGGGIMIVTNYLAIGQYLERLAIEPTAECLTTLSASDSRKLKRAITGFFHDQDLPSKTADGSSSGLVSPPTASNE